MAGRISASSKATGAPKRGACFCLQGREAVPGRSQNHGSNWHQADYFRTAAIPSANGGFADVTPSGLEFGVNPLIINQCELTHL